MEAIALVAGLAILQVFVFAFSVGKARVTYEIDAPATSGNAKFERIFRVHQNTVEQLVIFLPGLWMFGNYVDPNVGAAVGVVFIISRCRMYKKRVLKGPEIAGQGFRPWRIEYDDPRSGWNDRRGLVPVPGVSQFVGKLRRI